MQSVTLTHANDRAKMSGTCNTVEPNYIIKKSLKLLTMYVKLLHKNIDLTSRHVELVHLIQRIFKSNVLHQF